MNIEIIKTNKNDWHPLTETILYSTFLSGDIKITLLKYNWFLEISSFYSSIHSIARNWLYPVFVHLMDYHGEIVRNYFRKKRKEICNNYSIISS